MNFIKKSLLFFVFLLLISKMYQSRLVYLMEISRHGAKYPNKNVSAIVDPPNLKGQLTGVGMRQQYLLGSYIYKDYIQNQQLISGKLNNRQIEIISTSYQRAIDSAYSQAYGLFPVNQSHIIPEGFPDSFLNPPFDLTSNLKRQFFNLAQNTALDKGFQPAAILVDDSLINNCPSYGVFYSQRLKQISKNLTVFQGQHSLQISKMILTFNVSVTQGTIPAMADLYSDIVSTIYLGRDLPKQFNDYDLKSLRYISDYYNLLLQSGYFGETLSTPLLKFMIERFSIIQKTSIQKKFTYFSCHSQNLIQLQLILNLTSIDCINQKWNNQTVTSLNCMDTPDFAANMIFEIHEDEQTFSYQIKVKYNGQYANLCDKKSTSCQLNEFIDRLSKYVHNDYQKQCGITNQTQKDIFTNENIIVIQ